MPVLSDKTYLVLKWFITIFLPAAGAFYFALAQIFDFSRVPGVNGTINAVIAFLGVLLGASTRTYNRQAGAPDADLVVTEDEGVKQFSLNIRTSPEELASKDKVQMKVVDISSELTVTDPNLRRPE